MFERYMLCVLFRAFYDYLKIHENFWLGYENQMIFLKELVAFSCVDRLCVNAKLASCFRKKDN